MVLFSELKSHLILGQNLNISLCFVGGYWGIMNPVERQSNRLALAEITFITGGS